VGQFGYVAQIILPAAGFQPALAASKAAAAKIGRPPKPNWPTTHDLNLANQP
jgi:hypothetical protein